MLSRWYMCVRALVAYLAVETIGNTSLSIKGLILHKVNSCVFE
jgi:hypothetical protein